MAAFLDLYELSSAVLAGCTTGLQVGFVVTIAVAWTLVVVILADRLLDPNRRANNIAGSLAALTCVISTFFDFLMALQTYPNQGGSATKWWLLRVVTGYTRGMVIVGFVAAVARSVKALARAEGEGDKKMATDSSPK